ncbi:hypothetical protein FA15DRAFT_704418 [Coprinopsis marcescibilis]|uniref:chitinase n=1 Tax=Coprinopsis marcescibilis TaxID=230819 RepID=A0A5C3KWU5_COPMA|nr:hypothetical protein FA15DRAFT_704418 [Coprinopsis marcescibilis]
MSVHSRNTSYQRVPTNPSFDSSEDLSTEESKFASNVNNRSKRSTRVVYAVLGFIVTAILFYFIGRLSVTFRSTTSPILPVTPTNPAVVAEPSSSIHQVPLPTATPVPNKNDTMSITHGGKKSVGYFVNWGIYGRKYLPKYIPVNDLTHILYAFANVNPSSGTVALSDVWADQDIHYPGDTWNIPGGEKHLFGNFKAIYLLKKKHRHLKLLLSIGGWTYSPNFHPVVVDRAKRAEFVRSSVELLDDYGLDGLDVDYEYPRDEQEAHAYVELLKELRHALDQREIENGNGCRFLLTIAAPCGPDHYKKLIVKEMDRYLSFWNLMSYDYSGSWDTIANHQANMYGAPINTHDALTFYTSHGVEPSKLVLGVPLYGRSFASTGGPGTKFEGTGRGTWEKGVYDYRVLPLPFQSTYVYNDENVMASWTLDGVEGGEMVSYDTPVVAKLKGEFIRDNGLGGSMFWELSGDKMPSATVEEVENKNEREAKMKEAGEGVENMNGTKCLSAVGVAPRRPRRRPRVANPWTNPPIGPKKRKRKALDLTLSDVHVERFYYLSTEARWHGFPQKCRWDRNNDGKEECTEQIMNHAQLLQHVKDHPEGLYSEMGLGPMVPSKKRVVCMYNRCYRKFLFGSLPPHLLSHGKGNCPPRPGSQSCADPVFLDEDAAA